MDYYNLCKQNKNLRAHLNNYRFHPHIRIENMFVILPLLILAGARIKSLFECQKEVLGDDSEGCGLISDNPIQNLLHWFTN
jgi:hypothetical protein